VTFHVDIEAISTEAISDWSGLNSGKVDTPGGKLLKHFQQPTGTIVRKLDHHAGFVLASLGRW
jgi:hypothetical protein